MKKILFISLAVVLALSIGLIGCEGEGEEPGPPTDKVYLFAARPLTGTLESIGDYGFGPIMDYWQDKVNKAGGIDVGGTIGNDKLVDLTIVDDTSDLGVMTGLLSSAIASNDYHFMLSPCSTSFVQAAAGICSGNEYVLLGAEGGCTTIQDQLDSYDYLFATLSFSTWGQTEALFEVLRAWQTGPESAPDPMNVYIMYIGDLHGFEYRDAFIAGANSTAYDTVGHFNIVGTSSVPLDAVSVQTQLEAAQTANADLLCSFVYPPASFLTVSEAIALDINFDAMMVGPGINFEFMLLPPVAGIARNLDLQGVMGFASWNEESGGNATADFAADLTDFFSQPEGTTVNGTSRVIINMEVGGAPNPGRFILDWWGSMPYIAGLEMLQEAIERTNSLDNDDIRAEFAKGAADKFSTTFGDAWFVKNEAGDAPGADSGGLLCLDFFHGHIGQWQHDPAKMVIPKEFWAPLDGCDGWMIYEVIDEGVGTADGIYPKPAWGYNCS